jgi:signal peptidase
MPALLRWARRLIDATLMLAVLAVVVIGGLTLAAPVFGARTLVVDGASMQPTIPRWSYIVVVRQPADAYAVGDLITVQEAGRTPYTHRLVRLATLDGASYVETRGDANAAADPALVPVTSVVGRVAFQLPLLGFLAALLAIPLGLVGFLAVAGMLLCLVWLIEDLEADQCPICAALAEDPPVLEAGTEQLASGTEQLA